MGGERGGGGAWRAKARILAAWNRIQGREPVRRRRAEPGRRGLPGRGAPSVPAARAGVAGAGGAAAAAGRAPGRRAPGQRLRLARDQLAAAADVRAGPQLRPRQQPGPLPGRRRRPLAAADVRRSARCTSSRSGRWSPRSRPAGARSACSGIYPFFGLLTACGFALSLYFALRPLAPARSDAAAPLGSPSDEPPWSGWERALIALFATLLSSAALDYAEPVSRPLGDVVPPQAEPRAGTRPVPLGPARLRRASAGGAGAIAAGVLLHVLGWVFVIHMGAVCVGLVAFAVLAAFFRRDGGAARLGRRGRRDRHQPAGGESLPLPACSAATTCSSPALAWRFHPPRPTCWRRSRAWPP